MHGHNSNPSSGFTRKFPNTVDAYNLPKLDGTHNRPSKPRKYYQHYDNVFVTLADIFNYMELLDPTTFHLCLLFTVQCIVVLRFSKTSCKNANNCF